MALAWARSIADAQGVGNVLNSDRSTVSIAGMLDSNLDIDIYEFEVMYDSIITAGHLFDYKHPKGANMKTVTDRIRVAVPREGEELAAVPQDLAAALASWLLLPSTKLSNVNSGLSRDLIGVCVLRAAGLAAAPMEAAGASAAAWREPTSTTTSVLVSVSSTTSRIRSR